MLLRILKLLNLQAWKIKFDSSEYLCDNNTSGGVIMAKDIISFSDFDKIEFKLGVILECEKHPKADRLLVFQVDVGEEQPRQIISSIADFYNPEDQI